MPKSYRHSRVVTTVIIERRATAWYLTGVGVSSLYPNQHGDSLYTLTATADAESVRLHRAAYGVFPVLEQVRESIAQSEGR